MDKPVGKSAALVTSGIVMLVVGALVTWGGVAGTAAEQEKSYFGSTTGAWPALTFVGVGLLLAALVCLSMGIWRALSRLDATQPASLAPQNQVTANAAEESQDS